MLSRSSEMFADAIDLVVSWDENTDLTAPAGSPVRLKFVLHDADLYSIRFRERCAA